jgi:P-type Cu2+ transporter
MTKTCFHCGLPLPTRVEYHAVIDSVNRAMCCAGCSAVAHAISDAGLSDYYRSRDALPAPAGTVPNFLAELSAYDHTELQDTFVHHGSGQERDAAFLLEGIRCAACVWLIERRLRKLPGVMDVGVNHATQRMRVQWNAEFIKLSAILSAVAEIGYRASPYDPEKAERARRAERRQLLKQLAVAGLCMMQVMMFAIPIYLATEGEIAADHRLLMNWASLLLTVPVLVYSARPFFIGAWKNIRNRSLGMDTPVALGIGAGFSASVWSTLMGRGDVYFDSVTMFVFLLLGVRFLERQARSRSDDMFERLARVLPEYCQRFDDYPASRDTQKVSSERLRIGDNLLIGSGERIPADGVVLEGSGENDESLISGESRPVPKSVAAHVIAGAVNLGSPLIIRATAVGAQNTVGKIARLVDRALGEKPAIARLADRAANWFVLGLLAVTIAAAAYWGLNAPERTLPVVIGLLLITCPCALGLAVPTVVTVATHRLVQIGLLPTRGHAIEAMSQVTDVIFDKTGTLTRGAPTLMQVTLLGSQSEAQVIAIAAALEASSSHPLGKALRAATSERGAATELTTRPGSGIQGKVENITYRIGTLDFVRGIAGQPPVEPHAAASTTLVALGSEHGWLAFFHLTDALRPESRAVIGQLQAMGKTVHILSGDSPGMVTHIAIEAGLSHGRGGATPQQKLAYIHALQAQGAVVAMIGDGVNDAPSLGGAQVSIAMGSGADLAQTTADMVLLSSDLNVIPAALRIAKAASQIMRQNLAWASVYNLVAIPLAAFGLVTPLVAAIGMSVSSLVVVANALRMASRPTATRRSHPSPAFST